MTEGRHPVKATPMRAAIARRMVQSKQQVPHFYVTSEIEVDVLAPALLNCAERDVDDLAAGLGDLTARTRAGKLKAAEMTDATFTLSNLGMFEVTQFTAIVTPPQVAILAVGRGYERPVVRDGAVVVRRIMQATLSADHRAVDGA